MPAQATTTASVAPAQPVACAAPSEPHALRAEACSSEPKAFLHAPAAFSSPGGIVPAPTPSAAPAPPSFEIPGEAKAVPTAVHHAPLPVSVTAPEKVKAVPVASHCAPLSTTSTAADEAKIVPASLDPAASAPGELAPSVLSAPEKPKPVPAVSRVASTSPGEPVVPSSCTAPAGKPDVPLPVPQADVTSTGQPPAISGTGAIVSTESVQAPSTATPDEQVPDEVTATAAAIAEDDDAKSSSTRTESAGPHTVPMAPLSQSRQSKTFTEAAYVVFLDLCAPNDAVPATSLADHLDANFDTYLPIEMKEARSRDKLRNSILNGIYANKKLSTTLGMVRAVPDTRPHVDDSHVAHSSALKRPKARVTPSRSARGGSRAPMDRSALSDTAATSSPPIHFMPVSESIKRSRSKQGASQSRPSKRAKTAKSANATPGKTAKSATTATTPNFAKTAKTALSVNSAKGAKSQKSAKNSQTAPIVSPVKHAKGAPAASTDANSHTWEKSTVLAFRSLAEASGVEPANFECGIDEVYDFLSEQWKRFRGDRTPPIKWKRPIRKGVKAGLNLTAEDRVSLRKGTASAEIGAPSVAFSIDNADDEEMADVVDEEEKNDANAHSLPVSSSTEALHSPLFDSFVHPKRSVATLPAPTLTSGRGIWTARLAGTPVEVIPNLLARDVPENELFFNYEGVTLDGRLVFSLKFEGYRLALEQFNGSEQHSNLIRRSREPGSGPGGARIFEDVALLLDEMISGWIQSIYNQQVDEDGRSLCQLLIEAIFHRNPAFSSKDLPSSREFLCASVVMTVLFVMVHGKEPVVVNLPELLRKR